MTKTKKTVWKPVSNEEATELLCEGVHVGLRKGSEAPSSGPLWRAIADSKDGAWSDAVGYAVWALEYMGYAVCKKAE